MYIRTVFVQILDNYLLVDLNKYMDFVCIQTLASCLIALIYYLTIFVFSIYHSTSSIYYSISMLNSAYSAFTSSLTAMLWLLNNAPLCFKYFLFLLCWVGWPSLMNWYSCFLTDWPLFLAFLTSLWWVWIPPLMDQYPCFDGLASLLGFSNVALVG